MMIRPDFSGFDSKQFLNAKSGSIQVLSRASLIDAAPECIQRIVQICNETAVYDFLFRRRLNGNSYDESMALGFLEWAKKGWDEGTHYVFIATDENGRIDAALDIKSNDLEKAEVGYWSSALKSGVVTPGLELMCSIASEAGFRGLTALTLPGNDRSQAVLRRNQFQDLGLIEERGRSYRKFVKPLIR